MLGAMLVGAWLLIQQQCCSVYGDSASRFRNAALVDPLMRRSPLEKNFMRFGRSSPPTFSRDARLKENFMRFGRPVLDPLLDFDEFPPNKNADPFFKRNEAGVNVFTDKTDDGFKDDNPTRARRAKNNFIRLGRDKDDSKERTDLPDPAVGPALFDRTEFARVLRAKENFMRFGRDKERVVRNEKGKQDSFIRFGKSENPENEDLDDCDETTDKRQTRAGDNFVRFGRGNDKFMRFGKKSDDSWLEKDKTISVRVARDRDNDNMVRTSRQKQKDNGFIRFGRSDREKRDTTSNKHKEASHHPGNTNPNRNSHHDQNSGVCKWSLLHDNNAGWTESECKDGSCRALYLPWPFYYQPSLYSVVPNLLSTRQVSMLPSPQLVQKPKRSRANLQNFIRLG